MWISLHRYFFSNRFRLKAKRGFTLIELLVVVAVITVITLMFLLRQSKFNSATLLRSLAYSTALSVRQAQVYGTSVLGTSISGSLQYASGYGLYFTTTSPSQYILFADINNNGVYDSGEDIQVFKYGKGYQISEICALNETLSRKYCSSTDDDSGSGTITQLNIIFKRPNPDAQFAAFNAGVPVGSGYTSAYIQVKNTASSDATRSVYVNATGQIVVQTVGKLPLATPWP